MTNFQTLITVIYHSAYGDTDITAEFNNMPGGLDQFFREYFAPDLFDITTGAPLDISKERRNFIDSCKAYHRFEIVEAHDRGEKWPSELGLV